MGCTRRLAICKWFSGVSPNGSNGALALPVGCIPDAIVLLMASGLRRRDGRNGPVLVVDIPKYAKGSGPSLKWWGAGKGCPEGAHTELGNGLMLLGTHGTNIWAGREGEKLPSANAFGGKHSGGHCCREKQRFGSESDSDSDGVAKVSDSAELLPELGASLEVAILST